MNESMTLGGWLKQRRKELGLSQVELAERLGFSTVMLWKIESGERRPSGQIANLLADYFHIPDDEREAFVSFARAGSAAQSAAPDIAHSTVSPWRSAYVRQTNLPTMLTRLVGREREAATARAQITNPKTRLLTLTGAPGIGKTHLAVQVASEVVEHIEDGVIFVDLAPISDPEQVLATIARSLGLRESTDRSLEGALMEHVREKRMLLLLDNFEQVLDAAPEVARLLRASPWLKVLVTSREPLRVRGEQRFSVPPLSRPDLARLPSPDELAGYASVELFVERAQQVAEGFSLEQSNAEDVAVVCVELEGLPLAIELAAARADLLPPREIRAALDNRLKLLTMGARDLPLRQQTLRSAIEWSYDLLDEEEQLFFNRLGVFAGGFTRQAVEAISGPDARLPAAATIASLVDKSLVRMEKPGSEGEGEGEGEGRYAMLEAIREFSLDRLHASGEANAAHGKHAHYYLSVAEEAGQQLRGSNQKAPLDLLEREHANMRVALAFLLDEAYRDEQALALGMRLCDALSTFWYVHGYASEGRSWLEAFVGAQDSWLAHSKTNAGEDGKPGEHWILPRAAAMSSLGMLLYMQGDIRTARKYYGESFSLSKQAGDRLRTARALNNLGMLATEEMDLDTARGYYEEALGLAQELGQSQGITRILNNLGVVAHKQGDYVGARRYYEESLEIRRALGDKQGEGAILTNIGGLAVFLGDLVTARAIFTEALEIGQEFGDKFTIGRALVGLGDVARASGDYKTSRSCYGQGLYIALEIDTKQIVYEAMEGLAELAALATPPEPARAAKILGAADAVREAASSPRFAAEQSRLDNALAEARATLGDVAWQAAWAEGQAMALDEAVAYALEP